MTSNNLSRLSATALSIALLFVSGLADAAGAQAPEGPSAACAVAPMNKIYGGLLPPNPFVGVTAATECLKRAHDAIIVLGCPNEKDGRPSRCQTKRADVAMALMRAGFAKRFIPTGASVHSPGVEAESLKTLLIARGASPENIFVDPKARHTDENIYYSDKIMASNGWTTALVVSESPGHLIYTALCDSNCCVKKGRLTVFRYPVVIGNRKVKETVGHYVRFPTAAKVSAAECKTIRLKLMCTNEKGRRACADNFKLPN